MSLLLALLACAPAPEEPPVPEENVFRAANPTPDAPIAYTLTWAWPGSAEGVFRARTSVVVDDPLVGQRGAMFDATGRVDLGTGDAGARTVTVRDAVVEPPRPVQAGRPMALHAATAAAHMAWTTASRSDALDAQGAWVQAPFDAEAIAGATTSAVELVKRTFGREEATSARMKVAGDVVGRLLAAPRLSGDSAARWADAIGAWPGSTWQLGRARTSTETASLAYLGGGNAEVTVTRSLAGRVPCPGDPSRTCVHLRTVRTLEPGAATRALADHIATVVETVADEGARDVSAVATRASMQRDVVADPDTLLPFEERVVAEIELELRAGGARLRYSERHDHGLVMAWTVAATDAPAGDAPPPEPAPTPSGEGNDPPVPDVEGEGG